MSRWGKSIVVPLDSLCKEKEGTNRPTVARSVGTVGKWGKMGFTSTRTYALSAIPAAVAAAAAAAVAASPSESPASVLDDDLSPSVPEPPKPKKFFKSRNAAPPEVIAQLIQNLPRTSTSPIRDGSTLPNVLNTPVRESIKLKIPKSNSAERKKKATKKPPKSGGDGTAVDGADAEAIEKVATVKKLKKKKEEKKLKPEAPPSRIIARTRKTVNYCEDDDDRMPTPIKDYILPKSDEDKAQGSTTKAKKQLDLDNGVEKDINFPPPTALPLSYSATNTASKTPEHPPIVLRISKGTSRLVSTDSEEQQYTHSPRNQETDSTKSPQTSAEEVPVPTPIVIPTTPKIIVKAPKPPAPASPENHVLNDDEPHEINYCTVKISPDKPPKERLKLIIKTDVIRTALAKAAAAAAAKAASSEKAAAAEQAALSAEPGERPEKEKNKKSKKHKHPKHAVLEQLTPTVNEFKTPSPHPALVLNADQQQQRTIVSPPAISERDFDSQSSVLGSISSKGNSTPLAPTQLEESCVIRSRGSSVITSDLETSQHSSLVAAPSDIESRLESMMMTMEGDASQRVPNIPEEPLQEDILAVLCGGDESQMDAAPIPEEQHLKLNGINDKIEEQENHVEMEEEEQQQQEDTKRRFTRGRGRGVLKTNYAEDADDNIENTKAVSETTNTRTRGRKQTALPVNTTLDEAPLNKRATRRVNKKTEETLQHSEQLEELPVQTAEEPLAQAENAGDAIEGTETFEPAEEEHLETAVPVTRRGRQARNASNNNNLTNNNNNINKIAANLSAKAGAAEDAKGLNNLNAASNLPPRSYGRKRKNQQVTQVIQPSPAELEEHQPTPAKIPNIAGADAVPESMDTNAEITTNANQSPAHASVDPPETANSRPNSTTPSPTPASDYKIKDKFKRTLTIDTQAINAVVDTKSSNTDTNIPAAAATDEEQRGAVKLVISKKKGSIFKSRALVQSDQQEATAAKRYLYKHSWDADNDRPDSATEQLTNKTNDKTAPARSVDIFSDFDQDIDGSNKQQRDSPLIGKFTRVVKPSLQPNVPNPFDSNADGEGDTVTSVRVDRKAKDFYTVVRNVKSAHQIQEIGEYQEMDDDVEYILDALQPHNPTPTRCLSALQLATKCMTPAFRMHVRAHGIVTKFFKALSDANTDLSLGLCTSAVMFILSQEGLNMDLDRDSLELMMNLLEAESIAATPSDHAIYERNKQKVRELCEEIKAQGKAAHLNIDALSVGTLAMETLLSLTSKRAGEWFKEDLRQLGGLEHIFKTITDCCRPVIEFNSDTANINWTQSLIENMQTVERCMRVLENVTQMNEENQKYMLDYAQGDALNTLCSLYQLCDRQIMLYPTTEFTSKDDPGVVLRTLLISVLKILINLTHSFFNPAQAYGAELLGKRTDIWDTSLHLLLQTPNYIPERCVFELSMLVLLLLINLTMFTVSNRTLLIRSFAPPEFGTLYHDNQSKLTAVQAIMEYFYKCEELARLVEKNTDAILDNTEKTKKKQEEVDETVNNLLQTAGHHMEHTLKGSYAAILIGQLITDSEEYEAVIRTHLRDNSFKELIGVLEKYYNFMNLTASSEACAVAHIKATKKLIDNFKKRELVHKMNEADDSSMPLNLETTHHSATTVDSDAADAAASSINSRSSSGSSSSNSSTPSGANVGSTAPLRVYKTYSQR